jgi:hypothetical protein
MLGPRSVVATPTAFISKGILFRELSFAISLFVETRYEAVAKHLL